MATETSASCSYSDLAVPPGELLEEETNARGMTQQELARRMGRPTQAINEIIHGKKQITPETALLLERVLGVPAQLWLNLESRYRLILARQRESESLANQTMHLGAFPVRELERRGWVPKGDTAIEQVWNLTRFFGVSSLHTLASTANGLRITPGANISTGTIQAWMRRADQQAEAIQTAGFDPVLFRKKLARIRTFTSEDIHQYISRAESFCAEAGVALVFIEELPKSGACGYARWLTPDKAMIALSLRYKTADHLWFSFFHEAGHILLHPKRQTFLEADGISRDDTFEREADMFAADLLIPPQQWAMFISGPHTQFAHVRAFAESIAVAPGIVVGRLQHEGLIGQDQLNMLKIPLRWTESTGSKD